MLRVAGSAVKACFAPCASIPRRWAGDDALGNQEGGPVLASFPAFGSHSHHADKSAKPTPSPVMMVKKKAKGKLIKGRRLSPLTSRWRTPR